MCEESTNYDCMISLWSDTSLVCVGDLGGTIDSSKSAKSEKSGDSSPPAPTLDENIVMTFLTGEMCLRGVYTYPSPSPPPPSQAHL